MRMRKAASLLIAFCPLLGLLSMTASASGAGTPATGDSAPMLLPIVLLAVSAAALCVLLVLAVRKRRRAGREKRSGGQEYTGKRSR